MDYNSNGTSTIGPSNSNQIFVDKQNEMYENIMSSLKQVTCNDEETDVLEAASKLVFALQKSQSAPPPPDCTVSAILRSWLQMPVDEIAKRVQRLELEKTALQTQSSVLNELVKTQTEKIKHMSSTISCYETQIREMREKFRVESKERASLEQQKSFLLNLLIREIENKTNLQSKLKQATGKPPSGFKNSTPNSSPAANVNQFSSLPRQSSAQRSHLLDQISPIPPVNSAPNKSLVDADRSNSAPDLADREANASLDSTGGFVRGGFIRGTVTPCTLYSQYKQRTDVKNEKIPFQDWPVDTILAWLAEIGLSDQSLVNAKKWVKSSVTLLNSTNGEIEKNLEIKNPLLRKKLHLALLSKKGCTDELLIHAGKMDVHGVLQWLDDIGLVQYKQIFSKNSIDGRMLHRLTTHDLNALHINNEYHIYSLRSGIRLLRKCNFNQSCFVRREFLDEPMTPEHIACWTVHRVMQWLEGVDLSEYASHLRASGVHGAFLIYEPKFNAELLATVLAIPLDRTLLRRHLNAKFKQLLGPEIMHEKRIVESRPDYAPLSTTSKAKFAIKMNLNIFKKTHKYEIESEDFIAPIEGQPLSLPQ
ncbi:hypothetical protein M8J76_014592 [Diaphorina citri]|nr:hypothetical protein M8J75_007433 [Diaphorina citri]KAI5730518.1 hypothetical protein M8J76_014592 [Diaphorina citri]